MKKSRGRTTSSLRKALPLMLLMAFVMGSSASLLANDAKGGGNGQTNTAGGNGQTDSSGKDYTDRNRNGKKDWHESGFYGKTPCEKATIIRDVGSTGALVSGATGFGPGMIIFGGIGLWGQMMVWGSC